MMRHSLLTLILLPALLVAPAMAPASDGPRLVTLDSPSPLVEIRVMVDAGSSDDPAGKEGLASLTASLLLEGSFGDPAEPVTKEELAARTRAWGGGASPNVRVAKEATTFRMRVPRDVVDVYVDSVFGPLFTRPLFDGDELERLRKEGTVNLSSWLRYENIEMLGLEALDNYLFDGSSYAHTTGGSVQGLANITLEDVRGFYERYYRPGNVVLGVASADEDVTGPLLAALSGLGDARGDATRPADAVPPAPAMPDGREAIVVGMPDALATGIHLAYPLPINRTHEDFWPLYVANVALGTHRDGHGRLYGLIRQERGYNYGDYSYVEHFAARPWSLFPPFNTPREQQYFSLWIRPVGHEYAHHLLKAAIHELDLIAREGLTAEEVAHSKNKARVLYLSLAETGGRLLEAKLDDAWYGMEEGYLEHYLERIASVTPEQVNAAIERYLQADNLKILVVTAADRAGELAGALVTDGEIYGKSLQDYDVATTGEGDALVYELPASRLSTVRRDAVWANTPLGLAVDRVRVVPVEALFEAGGLVHEPAAAPGAR